MERLDPELVAPLKGVMEATGGGFDLSDIPATRAIVDAMLEAVNAEAPAIRGVGVEDRTVPSHEAGVEVPVRIYRPDGQSEALPVLVWMHAGGYVIGSIAMDDIMARQLAKDIGCAVVSVNYRLAPEHPYPAALEDGYGVLQWVGRKADEEGFDAGRIAVGGASAGGGLAAGLALVARDRDGVRPMFQLLIYPDIDDSGLEPASESVPENLFWSRENTRIGWNAYLAGKEGSPEVPEYAAPARATDLKGLPDAFIGVGTADMLLDENIDYAERMSAAGAKVDLRVYPGAFHAFDAFAPMTRVAQAFVADRNGALRRAFE
ncbi:MAG TPA: alpha/beta hydrolase [Gammaproteobacteria bacterium]|nr:alpha/beta hydrolase [Gammaproteobacteria bacterium]